MSKFLMGIGVLILGFGVFLYAVLPQKVDRTDTVNQLGRPSAVTGDLGIVNIAAPSAQAFTVTLGSGAGGGTTTAWEAGDDGTGTKTIALTLNETGGKAVRILTVTWLVYDAGNTVVTGGTIQVADTNISANGSGSVSVDITLSEGMALQFDTAAGGTADQSGSGKIVFTVTAQDTDNGLAATVVNAVCSMTVAKP